MQKSNIFLSIGNKSVPGDLEPEQNLSRPFTVDQQIKTITGA